MDNFERLFNEKRRVKSRDNSFMPSPEELEKKTFPEKNILAEWLISLKKAVNYYNEKNYAAALIHINKSIDKEKNNQHLYRVRANIKEDSGDLEGAILDYKESINIEGSDWYSVYNQIALNYYKLKEFPKALIAFDIALDLKVELTKIKGDIEDSIPNNADGFVLKVDFERIFSNRANVKLRTGDYQGCLDDCNAAIQINPEYSNPYFIIGMLFAQIGQRQDSIDALQNAKVRGNPNAVIMLNQLYGL